jgi:hypothetical protein
MEMDKRGNESVVGEERATLSEVDLRTLLRMGAGAGFRIAVAPVATLDEIKRSMIRED